MVAITAHKLTRRFGTRTAVDQLDLEIASGEVFGFLGPNGAGKTTTVRMLTALIGPTEGSATIAGHKLGQDDMAIRRSVGILTETPGLYEQLTAEQNLVFFAQLYDLDRKQAHTQSEKYLRLLGLWDRRNDIAGTFSKGMRQKLAIARALLHEPPIVFLDEPSAGLDPEAAKTMREFIKELRAEGRTIFLTSHNLAEVDELCDRVGLFKGRLLRVDTPDGLRTGLFGRHKIVELAGPAAQWLSLIQALPFVKEVQAQRQTLIVSLDDPTSQSPLLVHTLTSAGALVQNISDQTPSLEDVYLRLIPNSAREEVVS
jgi:ABC-2 type transport system ATP-binding protein